jgi:flagellar assembly protein FliH
VGDGLHQPVQNGHGYVPLVDEYQRGVEAGKSEASKELQIRFDGRIAEERKRIAALMTSIRNQIILLQNRWEHSVMKFSLSIAQLVIKQEVTVNREIVLGQVREALRHLVGVEKVKLRVHPDDEEVLRHRRAEVSSASDSLKEMVIEADDKIDRGSCIVESDSGNVDARLSTQLNRIESLLFEQRPTEAQS